MATNRPNLGLQIALIIFVMLTIALAVSTFIYFKKSEEIAEKMDAAEKSRAEAQRLQQVAKGELEQIKPCLGRGPGDQKVDLIVEEFKKDQTLYGVTFPEPGQNYPQMLKSVLDAYMIALGKAADLEKTVARLENENKEEKDKVVAAAKTFDAAQQASTTELLDDRKKFVDARGEFEASKEELSKRIEEKNKQLTDNTAKAQRDVQALEKVNKERTTQLEGTRTELEGIRKTDYNAPDGIIVRVSQREHTVWIDKGRADGIKEQMIFSVYDRTASNIAGENVKAKGSIEVIRILGDHASEATITKDDLKNPIMKEDKIMNVAYRAGKPEHFAVAGFIDMDGDGQSDMNRLLTLISNNGGIVDAMIDDDGKLTGAITASTKLLVLGERPTENAKSPDAIKSFSRLTKDATDAKVNTITLGDFIKYMGYQGSERSVPLGKGAGASGGPFKPRPARGATGGAF